MVPARRLLAALFALVLAAPVSADDQGAFVIRLGQDTTAVEQYTRTDAKIETRQVGRAPRVLERLYTYEFAKGEVTAFSMVVTPPGGGTPTQTIRATFAGDSARITTQSGTSPAQNTTVAFPAGSIIVANSSPWTSYESLAMRMIKDKRDSLRTSMLVLGSASPTWVSLRRLGKDSVLVVNGRQDEYHLRVDQQGRILGVLPVAGTQKVSAERVAKLDLAALGASFAAREQAGAGMGTLSPRDSVITTVAGASLKIDYGRPGKRGRVIFGQVVPYGEVWRTGANAATQFRTDRALDFAGNVLPPGFYTLWTLPTASGWKLIVNSETGQWGTARKGDKDLFSVDMKVSTLPQVVERFTIGIEPSGEGGVLNLDWDTTRASVAFTVKP